jgi:hypothetical protein
MSRSRTLVLLVLALLVIAVGLLLRGLGSREERALSQVPRSTAEGELDPAPAPAVLAHEGVAEADEQQRVAERPAASASAAPKGDGELAFFGRVVRAADRSPVARALITLHRREGDALGRALSGRPVVPLGNVRSDDSGLFELHCAPERALALCVDAPASSCAPRSSRSGTSAPSRPSRSSSSARARWRSGWSMRMASRSPDACSCARASGA